MFYVQSDIGSRLWLESHFLLLDTQVTKICNVAANIFVGLNANFLLQTASAVSSSAPLKSLLH